MNCVLSNGVMSLFCHHSDSEGSRPTMKVTEGDKEISLSVVKGHVG